MDERFVKERMREFDSAKEVLEPSVGGKLKQRVEAELRAEQDPLLIEAKRKHRDDLMSFIGQWDEGLERFCDSAVRLIEEFSAGGRWTDEMEDNALQRRL